jgi:hypothetical protein
MHAAGQALAVAAALADLLALRQNWAMATWVKCWDAYFRRFSPIFGVRNGVISFKLML